MKKSRFIAAVVIALALSGCASLPGLGDDITTAQAQFLAAQQAERDARRQDRRDTIDALSRFAASTEPLIHAMAIAAIERTSGADARAQPAAQMPAQQDGPIATVIRAVLPMALPIAQLWLQDRSGKRSHAQALANMDLVGSIVGQIQRDPLVIETPPAQIVNAPDPIILTPPPPIILTPPPPIILPPPSAE